MFDLENEGQSQSATFAVIPFDDEYQSACIKLVQSIFALPLSQTFIFLTFDTENFDQGHLVENIGLTPFDVEYQCG